MPSRSVNTPRQSTERLTIDCSQRGSGMEILRKDGHPGMTMRPELRPPPPIPGRRPPPPRGSMQNGMDSLPKRNTTQGSAGLLRHCYPMQANGSVPPSHGYPPSTRPVIDGAANYEPRYSKSGKLVPRSQDSRPMPPPVVMLRTGPLGTYPDAETLKRSEMASSYNRLPDRNGTNSSDYDRQYHKSPSQGDISQQIFVDTNSYSNGQSMTADHLAIPYRIPQVSPKNPRAMFDGNSSNNGMRKEPLSLPCSRSQPSPSSNHFQNSSPSNGFKNRTLPTGSRPLGDCSGSPMDYRNRRPEPASPYYDERGILHEPRNPPCPRPNPSRNGLPAEARIIPPNTEDDVIYANQQLPYHSSNSNKKEYPPDQQHTPSMLNGNGPLYENSMRNGSRVIQDSCPENIYANHHVANSHYTNQSNQQQISNYDSKHGNCAKNLRSDRRNTHPPPPVAQKPSHSLPQPSEMVMITETRGWNGQASSTYAKDVVKPTPRMPRLPNGLLASSAQLTTVPAYQCVINELSSRPPHQVSPTDSSTLSLRSSYDSSSSSSREFCRRPNKSVDGGVEQRRTSEGGLKSSSSHQQIDKSLLSASMTSLCSDASSSVSSRPRQESSWESRMTDDNSKRKEKSSIFSASPWEREEKEKLQHEQILDARRARDQEIAYLESIPDRTEKQNEWLRILRLEREFQRRAEMHDDEDSICSDTSSTESSSDKMANFPRDKLTVIPNERIGLKLLDELLDSPPKNSQLSNKSSPERELPLRSPSEKHFIPLDVAIPDNELQPSSLPMTNNILKISSEQHSDGGSRVSKPPVPAPRPSKALLTSHLQEIHKSSEILVDPEQMNGKLNCDMEANVSSLTKLEISDSSAFFCAADSEEHGPRETPQDNWLIEVPNNFPDREDEQKSKPSGMSNEQSRIYENIKPADYHYLRTQTVSSSGYSSHTLPKSTTSSTGSNPVVSSKEINPPRNGSSRMFEKKFPVMGVSSTLTKKANGFAPSDVDILPSLYASYKVQNGYAKEVPADLEDKSPEFKKLWISRPEKLTFQDKIRKFSLQAGEDDLPKDRVKNSRAQREIENKFSEAQKRAAAQKATETQI
ncbi:uncharacterized protein TNIN_317641 [Trichonephila inaurata madagascariensis]|uniref:Uncharacterized protein n=1 Tax=Trichonephila inaurata madagascariensis TaxID=2747483 RepID=A0A8X7BRM5_9ARAC|nr:uncharacterized protein TNIN_317641 [Trichonephila inaurata madagascariensis]